MQNWLEYLDSGIRIFQSTMILGWQANEGCRGLGMGVLQHLFVCREHLGVLPLVAMLAYSLRVTRSARLRCYAGSNNDREYRYSTFLEGIDTLLG